MFNTEHNLEDFVGIYGALILNFKMVKSKGHSRILTEHILSLGKSYANILCKYSGSVR